MGRKLKCTVEEKVAAVEDYLNGTRSVSEIMADLSIKSTRTIRDWILAYQNGGIEALCPVKANHSYDKALIENPYAKPIFHSDRGYQYTSKVFQAKLQNQGMEQSMSRVGHCIDNGPTEGLWGIIKSEMYCMYQITDEQSLRSAIDGYMKFYAEERPQDRFCCKTPTEVRQDALSAKEPVQYPIAENKRIAAYKSKWCA